MPHAKRTRLSLDVGFRCTTGPSGFGGAEGKRLVVLRVLWTMLERTDVHLGKESVNEKRCRQECRPLLWHRRKWWFVEQMESCYC